MEINEKIRLWIGQAVYDNNGQMIFRENKGGLHQFLDVRGWGSIVKSFKNEEEAAKFQDAVGKWVANAVNQQILRDKEDEEMLTEAGL